jgi:hypothetical protein
MRAASTGSDGNHAGTGLGEPSGDLDRLGFLSHE